MRDVWRQTVRNPGFTLTLVLVFGFGIGATVAIFTVVHGVLLSPLPFHDPDRLVIVVGATYTDLDHWKTAPSQAALAVWSAGGVNLTDGEHIERVFVAAISAEFFDVFQVGPQLGRPLIPEDQILGSGHVAFVSDGFWRRRFGGDEGIAGHVIHLNGLPHTIVGVMPRGFSFPDRTDLWVPSLRPGSVLTFGLDLPADLPRGLRSNMIGRMRDGGTVGQARIELNHLNNQLREKYRETNRGFSDSIAVVPLRTLYVRDYEAALLVLFAAAGFLLLIACLNAGSLLLARALTRQKEVAIRLSLGAPPSRIVRQLLSESLFLALLGAVAGVLLAYWLVALVKVMGPADMPRLANVQLNQVALGFALCVCAIVGLTVGLAPVGQIIRRDVAIALSIGATRTTGRLPRRTWRTLVVCELALAFTLTSAAGLSLRSLFHLLDVDPGFRSDNLFAVEVSLPQTWVDHGPNATRSSGSTDRTPPTGVLKNGSRSNDHGTAKPESARHDSSWQPILDAVRRLPGVTVGAIGRLPMGGGGGGYSLKLPDGTYRIVRTDYVQGDYFQAMGIPGLAGRLFTDQDSAAAAKVMVVNERLARQVWESRDPVGEHLLVEGEISPRTVVGVVGNVKVSSLTERDRPQIYLPSAQPFRGGGSPEDFVLVVRTSFSPTGMVETARDLVAKAGKGIAVYRARTMQQVVEEATASPRFRGILLASFATVALTLALLGVYGIVAFSLARRTHEMGVRLSLGAQQTHVARMIIGEGMRLGAAGAIIGIILALALNRYLSSLLFGIGPYDPVILIGGGVLIVFTSACACLPSAIRAYRLDPVQILRYE